jgi:glucokinase|tara:strand:+ start:4461 stop:5444 length:984 start_codon:yes stop_codon:yes gene_type:complete
MTVGSSLVADIGATNARFQCCAISDDPAVPPLLMGEPLVLSTTAYSAQSSLLTDVKAHFSATQFVSALFAVAGPVNLDGRAVQVLNTGLQINAHEAGELLSTSVTLVNDFYAQAMAVPFAQNTQQLGGGEVLPQVKGVLGPGSGLGMATLVPNYRANGVRWQVLSSEGGHADLAPSTFLEAELWSILAQNHDHVCLETVLCGSGLVNLYRAMCGLWGSEAEEISAEEISQRGQTMSDPVCHQTLEAFAGFLGSAAANLALTVGARGGVYISGGIAPQMLDFLLSSPLRRRFEEKGDLSDYVKEIPILVVLDSQPGLTGAMYCLAERR